MTEHISIHTPHAGSDAGNTAGVSQGKKISIHTPHAGSDGAARDAAYGHPDFNPHSPCGERLFVLLIFQRVSFYFNPHSPCGERHPSRLRRGFPSGFQSTLPMRGATIENGRRFESLEISIHTPHAGSDEKAQSGGRSCQDFNPHSPCGERLQGNIDRMLAKLFQSTLPMRGATECLRRAWKAAKISIHTPHAGSDRRPRLPAT